MAWRRAVRRGVLLAYMVVLLTLTHLPPSGMRRIPIHLWDKLSHFIAYGVLGVLSVWALRDSVRRWTLLAGLLLFAVLDETTQPWIGRDCELGDLAADALGALTGAIVTNWILAAPRTRQSD